MNASQRLFLFPVLVAWLGAALLAASPPAQAGLLGILAKLGKAGAGAADEAAAAAKLSTTAKAGAVGVVAADVATVPAEVAYYLSKPAAGLSGTDTLRMMELYRESTAGASRALPAAPATGPTAAATAAAPAATRAAPAQAAGTAAKTDTSALEAAIRTAHLVRLVAHAASAGNHEAWREVSSHCAPGQKAAEPAWKAVCGRALHIQWEREQALRRTASAAR